MKKSTQKLPNNILHKLNNPHLFEQSSTSDLPKTKSTTKLSRFKLHLKLTKFKKVGIILATPIALLLIAVIISIVPLINIKKTATLAQASATQAVQATKSQDLITAQQQISQIKTHLETIEGHYRLLAWYKITPLRWHYIDGQNLLDAAKNTLDAGEIVVTTVEPYADIIGFSGEGSFTGGTAEDRIVKIVETIGLVSPNLSQVEQKLLQANASLSAINPNRYPFTIQGRHVSELITESQKLLSTGSTLISQFQPLLESLPSVAGLDEEKKYLVLFQNDAEIRPTGGFMTAYGVLRVDKGRVSQEKSDDIYSLDTKFNSRLKPPPPIQEHLPLVFYWHLRDMNLSPDFKTSMDTFLEHYFTVSGEPKDIDGVITVDTQMLSDLIRVLGSIDVPGFGTFTADNDPRCQCPQVIYELEDISTRPVAFVRNDRKAFLGPMMQTLILKAYGASSEVWPNLFRIVLNNVQQKHVLFYMFDEAAQNAAEKAGIAGKIESFEGDYFHVNDSNFGGAKSNLFIQEEVEIDINANQQGTTNSITVTYKNPAPASNCNLEAGELCLNGTYRDFVRFYVPKGSQLTEALGFKDGTTKTYEELGKTVFEGFFEFQPQSQAKLKLTYSTTVSQTDKYRLLIQKQPGKKAPKYTVTFNNQEKEEFDLISDKHLDFQL